MTSAISSHILNIDDVTAYDAITHYLLAKLVKDIVNTLKFV